IGAQRYGGAVERAAQHGPKLLEIVTHRASIPAFGPASRPHDSSGPRLSWPGRSRVRVLLPFPGCRGDSRGGPMPSTEKPFLTDIKTLRERARQHIEQGAITVGYRADRDTVVRLLNEALATEIVCVLRYKRHHYMASGIHAQSVAAEFAEHAAEEQQH